MGNIKIAIAGLGNCASSLVQGFYYYRDRGPINAIGLMHWEIGGYTPGDIEVVAAFDIDKRKVGKDVNEAIFSAPNCTTVFCDHLPASGVTVRMGRIADGIAGHMKEYEDRYTFLPADLPEPSFDDVVGVLKESGADILPLVSPRFV
jgi:myo-inositol-1-phosphate synthase